MAVMDLLEAKVFSSHDFVQLFTLCPLSNHVILLLLFFYSRFFLSEKLWNCVENVTALENAHKMVIIK